MEKAKTATGDLRLSTGLYLQMIESVCSGLESVPEHTGQIVCENGNYWTRYAAPTYILAVAAVEAFFNEFVILNPPPTPAEGSFEDLMKELLWTPVKDKPGKLAGLYKVNPCLGKPPYQDFVILVKVRDALVHYKAQRTTELEPPYVTRLGQVGVRIQHAGAETYEHQVLTIQGAIWACKIAIDTTIAFQKLFSDYPDFDPVITFADRLSPDRVREAVKAHNATIPLWIRKTYRLEY